MRSSSSCLSGTIWLLKNHQRHGPKETESSATIDVDQVRSLVGPEVKAVVAAHLSGSVARIDALADLCAGAGIPLIEDCAQAHGAGYAGKRVGSWGIAGIFSFGGIKLMTCGQG